MRYKSVFIAVALVGAVILSGCSRELTSEEALSRISALGEFQAPYFAPIRVGQVVLTGSDHADVNGYIARHYGAPQKAGLLTVDPAESNSWRTVLDVRLTPQGEAMADKRRATSEVAYVQVCRMVPTEVSEVAEITEGKVMNCAYLFEEREITPFGRVLGFEEGRSFNDALLFVRAGGSWQVQADTTQKI